jgi:hypothetical protein
MDTNSVRVHAPTPVLFICGGGYDATAQNPKSLRDAFLRIQNRIAFQRYDVHVAEELNAFFPNGKYNNILKFEEHFAQIADLILLFSESYGSAAELGAFSMVEEIALRLLVIIDDKNYSDNSFVKLGPILSLENTFGDDAVCVLNRVDINIVDIKTVEGLNIEIFADRMIAAFEVRQKSTRERTSFNPNRAGHIIKLIVGIIQHYGALTLDEIDVCLYCLNISSDLRAQAENFLLCAEFVKWIKKDRRGFKTFYSATATKEALQYKLKNGSPIIDKTRWRSDILEYWKLSDPERFNSIAQAIGGPAR